MKKTVTVFGSSSACADGSCYREARELGRELARAGFTVCNGGYGGAMEASARGAKEAGGRTVGIITRQFSGRRANKWIDRVKNVRTWRERLFKLIESGDGYAVCGGGTGTLVELSVVWEMRRKGFMPRKPVVVIGTYWKKALKALSGCSDIGRDHNFDFAKNGRDAARILINKL